MKTPTAPKWVGALALVLCAGVALADARLDARRNFRNGMSLIAEGKYDEGIARLQEAYAIKPHPNVLYNIARAYQDWGKLPEALEYYRRYLSASPADSGTVQATVLQIEDKLQATQQPQAARPPPPPPPPTPSTNTPAAGGGAALNPESQKALGALLERLEKAIARAESLPASQPSAAQPPVATDSELAPSASTEEDSSRPYEERVVTASRRAQSSLEAPNATTVITAEDIRASGANSLQELLRRVPGAEVMAMGVGSANVSLRGFNQRLANKVLVLVDGRTEYQDFLGLTIWGAIPVELSEIERIEVIRGPGSTLYGASAMLGVINIITRAPGTGPRARLEVGGGGGNTVNTSFASHGSSGTLRYRTSVGYAQADKWSLDFGPGRPDFNLVGSEPNAGLRSARGTAALTWQPLAGAQLSLAGGVNRYATELYPLGLLRNYYVDGINAHARMDASAGPLKLKTFWNHVDVAAGPQYEPVGQRSLATRVTSNIFNAELLYNNEFELLGTHQLNVGVEGRLKRVGWDYLQGPRGGSLVEELHAAAFVQDEWRLSDPLRLVASYRADRHPLLNNGQPGFAHSPRVSLLVLPWEGQSFRASVAYAFRVPTFLESYTRLFIPVPGVNGASALTTGDVTLQPENLVAFELGWRGEAPRLGVDWDVALYQNEVDNLIGLSAPQRLPVADSFDPGTGSFVVGRSVFQNEDVHYTARGAEAGVSLAPVSGLGVKLSAAWQMISGRQVGTDARDLQLEECAPCSQAPQLKLFGGVTYRTRSDLELSAEAAWTSGTTWIERTPSAADPTVVLPLSNPLAAHLVLHARVGYEPIKDRLMVAVSGTNLAAGHRQHPFGNQIERRIFATVTVTP